jgi:hypothetical protein
MNKPVTLPAHVLRMRPLTRAAYLAVEDRVINGEIEGTLEELLDIAIEAVTAPIVRYIKAQGEALTSMAEVWESHG